MSTNWTLWARKRWADEEPDIFSMSVESSTPDSKRHIVVSGCATWLTAEQGEEVAEFLQKCIALCKAGPQTDADPEDVFYGNGPVREQIQAEREQVPLLGPDGFRTN